MAQGDLVGTVGTNVDSTNGTSSTCALGHTATVGNLLVATASWDKDVTSITCKDASGGDTWLLADSVIETGLQSTTGIWYKIADGDETQCFFEWTNSEQCNSGCSEWEGPWLASPLDLTDTHDSNGTTNSVPLGPTGTLAQADELCFGAAGWDTVGGSDAYSWDNSFVERYELNNPDFGIPGSSMATKLVSSTAAVSVTCTKDASAEEATGVLATFMLQADPVYDQARFRFRNDDGAVTEPA